MPIGVCVAGAAGWTGSLVARRAMEITGLVRGLDTLLFGLPERRIV